MKSEEKITKRVLLVGGGHTHALALRMFAMKKPEGVEYLLVSNVTHTPYSGMLPGFIAGEYDYGESHIDLRKLCSFGGFTYIDAEVTGIDAAQSLVILKDRPSLSYDYLSINVGCNPSIGNIPGVLEFATPVKPVPKFIEAYNEIIGRYKDLSSKKFAIVGGGAAGCEVAMAFRKKFGSDLQIEVFTKEKTIMQRHGVKVQRLISKELKKLGILVFTSSEITGVELGKINLKNGKSYSADEIFWFTQAAPVPFISNSDLKLDSDGFIEVNDKLQSLSHKNVFAAGDTASFNKSPVAKSGVYAVRQTPALYVNLSNAPVGKNLVAFRPQKKFLSLITTSHGSAIASKGQWAFQSSLMWKWKDYIDRKFMRKLQVFPAMDTDEGDMHCAGCAAKVDSIALRAALRRVKEDGDFAMQGFSAADDAAEVVVSGGGKIFQSVDYFPAFVEDPYVFGRLATLHSMSDIFAMGAKAVSAQAIIKIPELSSGISQEYLYQILKGITYELSKAGAKLLGGHTLAGDRIEVGLVVNGTVSDKPLLKNKCEIGDVLICTKPIGSGVNFAAAMRQKLNGSHLSYTEKVLLQTNDVINHIKNRDGIHSCTDITGFGLAGHLIEMVGESDLSIRIDEKTLPLLPGVKEMDSIGISSSSYGKNFMSFSNDIAPSQSLAYRMLFDPQTCGGLLMSVAAGSAQGLLEELREAGFNEAVVMGEVVAPDRKKIVWA